MNETLQVVLIVGGAAAALGAIGKYIFVPVGKFMRAVVETAAFFPTWKDIAIEFKPNDGHSLIDRIGHIELTTVEIQRTLENHIQDFETYRSTRR